MSEYHVMHITPLPDEPFHSLGSPCWCQPTVEDVPPSGRLVIHRRTLDSPTREPNEIALPEQGRTRARVFDAAQGPRPVSAPPDFGTQELGDKAAAERIGNVDKRRTWS